jgi:hypothetical protein
VLSESEIKERRLTLDDVVDIRTPTEVTVIRLEDGSEVETLTLLRYAGRYGQTSGFAVKTRQGKFVVRGAAQLGLTPDSPFALIA